MPFYQSLYDRLKNQHESIEHIISITEANRLSSYPSSEKWTIKDNVAHLARYQPIFLERINTILKNDSPIFERYNAEQDFEFINWRKREISDLIKTLKDDRQIIYNCLSKLSDEDLNRVGVHPKYGALTLIQWIEFFLLHEAHHIFTIFQIANDKQKIN